MPHQAYMMTSSSSIYILDKVTLDTQTHFRWESIKKFFYLATIFSNHIYNFDIFSKVTNTSDVKVTDFFLCQIFIGMSYMFMDCFIRMYTAKLDSNRLMNPLLRGVTFGLFVQTACNSIIHACYVADSFRFLISVFYLELPWLKCDNVAANKNIQCLSMSELALKCGQSTIYMNTTSAHLYYTNTFTSSDRQKLTTRFFVVGLVWTCIFFIATVSYHTLLKFFFLVFLGRLLSTLVVVLFILASADRFTVTAIVQMMDTSGPVTYLRSMEHVSYTYGIGFLGFFDFGTMSPFTMIDTAVIIFSILFMVFAIMRSWIVRVLFLLTKECVNMDFYIAPHYLLFAILPLSTHFLRAHRLYSLYLYLNVTISTTSYLTMLTLSMSKLLHTEFRSVKNVYIIGILCFFGFGLSIPVTASLTTASSIRVKGLVGGMNLSSLYLGALKVALVMWVYGVKRFSTDIQFWLGFKPTKFWTISWMVAPIVLIFFLVEKIIHFDSVVWQISQTRTIIAYVSFGLTILLVGIFHVKTITKYLLANNLAGLFKSSVKYGPPDPFDRFKRRNYDETLESRICNHNCQMVDELLDCNHMPLMQTSKTPSSSSTSEAETLEVAVDISDATIEFGSRAHTDLNHSVT